MFSLQGVESGCRVINLDLVLLASEEPEQDLLREMVIYAGYGCRLGGHEPNNADRID